MYIIAGAPPFPANADPLQRAYDGAAFVHNNLLKRGISEPGASYGTYQTYHETNGYTNNGWNSYNNASGIMFAGQKGAKKGPNGYAVFNTWDDYFNAFAYELRKKSNPSAANSLEEFAARLKQNGYYQANQVDYFSGLKRARLVLKVIPSSDRAGNPQGQTTATTYVQQAADLDIPGSVDYSKNQFDIGKWWNTLPTMSKVGIGAAAAFIFVKLLK